VATTPAPGPCIRADAATFLAAAASASACTADDPAVPKDLRSLKVLNMLWHNLVNLIMGLSGPSVAPLLPRKRPLAPQHTWRRSQGAVPQRPPPPSDDHQNCDVHFGSQSLAGMLVQILAQPLTSTFVRICSGAQTVQQHERTLALRGISQLVPLLTCQVPCTDTMYLHGISGSM
jgi:hypothetical protein